MLTRATRAELLRAGGAARSGWEPIEKLGLTELSPRETGFKRKNFHAACRTRLSTPFLSLFGRLKRSRGRRDFDQSGPCPRICRCATGAQRGLRPYPSPEARTSEGARSLTDFNFSPSPETPQGGRAGLDRVICAKTALIHRLSRERFGRDRWCAVLKSGPSRTARTCGWVRGRV